MHFYFFLFKESSKQGASKLIIPPKSIGLHFKSFKESSKQGASKLIDCSTSKVVDC